MESLPLPLCLNPKYVWSIFGAKVQLSAPVDFNVKLYIREFLRHYLSASLVVLAQAQARAISRALK
jgi:hypothetical protein